MFTLWRHRLESLPMTPPPDPGGPVLVLSAHPDDAVLAVGGWIATQARRDFLFVTASDGEASHPDSPTIAPDELAEQRSLELLAALEALGVDRPRVLRLRLPDGGLAEHRDELVERLRPLVDGADLVVAPFEADGHPDQETLGEVAARLCADDVVLWRFPVWTWTRTKPGSQAWLREARRVDCVSRARARKRRAVAAFRSQLRDLSDDSRDAAAITPTLLNHALLAPEVVLTRAS